MRRGLALVGYRGTGKTTTGRIVAQRLGWEFADADREIELRAGRSIASIFLESGEPAFRDWEERLLQELITRQRLVIATGGGTVLRETNQRALRAFGFVVWLQASPETLARRIAADPAERPALTSAGLLGEIREVLEARKSLYEATADLAIDTEDCSPEDVAELVLSSFQARLGLGGPPS